MLFQLSSLLTFAQQQHSLVGYVVDVNTNQPINNVIVVDSMNKTEILTNKEGKFLLFCNKKTTLILSHHEYNETIKDCVLISDSVIVFYLEKKQVEISEINIYARNLDLIKKPYNKISIATTTLQKIPSIVGEPDILKLLQLTPGVQNSGEGSVGLNVRGGDHSQNLILLDNIPVYNSSHLFGFVSVFNTDALSSVDFYKSGFPSQYGGRTSSIVDIKLKDNIIDTTVVNLSVGFVSAKIFIQLPVVKNKTNLIFSTRSTYLNSFLKLKDIIYKEENERLKNLGFYETNLKLIHKFSNELSFTYGLYYGKDIYSYGKKTIDSVSKYFSDESITWGNFINYFTFEKKTRSNNYSITFAKNDYFSKTISTIDDQNVIEDYFFYKTNFTSSSISDLLIKNSNTIKSSFGEINFGVDLFRHLYSPVIKDFNSKNQYTSFNKDTVKSFFSNELSLFVNSVFAINNKSNINLGFRFPYYYSSNVIFKTFEPRLAFVYSITDKSSLKLSTTKMSQFSNLLFNNTLGMPTDVWVPASKKSGFQTAWQYSFSFNKNIKKIDLSVELYYKKMNNLIDFKDNIYYVNYSAYENYIDTSGIGKSYGIEFWLNKSIGKFCPVVGL